MGSVLDRMSFLRHPLKAFRLCHGSKVYEKKKRGTNLLVLFETSAVHPPRLHKGRDYLFVALAIDNEDDTRDNEEDPDRMYPASVLHVTRRMQPNPTK